MLGRSFRITELLICVRDAFLTGPPRHHQHLDPRIGRIAAGHTIHLRPSDTGEINSLGLYIFQGS
jgi:hypothetical protein